HGRIGSKVDQRLDVGRHGLAPGGESTSARRCWRDSAFRHACRTQSRGQIPVNSRPNVMLNRQVASLRRWLWLVTAAPLLAGAISFVVSSSMAKTYTASLTLVVGDDTVNLHPSVEDVTVSQRLAAVYAGMVTREPVLTATVNALRLPTTWWEL